MIWGERKQTQQWVEPLFASLRVSENGEELLGYYILCGDAAAGLRKLPYERHAQAARRADPENWIFVFSHSQICAPGFERLCPVFATLTEKRLSRGVSG